MRTLRSFWRNLVRRTRVERDLHDEVTSYADMLEEDHVRSGMPPAAARRAARVAIGGVEQVKERVRDVKAGVSLQALWQDLRYATRVLRRNPAFSAAALLALALGIGANTAIFSVVDGVLLRPLPYPEPDRLAVVSMRFTPQNMNRGPLSVADYLDWRSNNRAFQEHAVYANTRIDMVGAPAPESISGVAVTSGFFSIVGVQPIAGRTLLAGEDAPSSGRLLILSEALWRRRFQGDPAVIGRLVIADGQSYTIVGVMPASFTFPRTDGEFWTNFRLDPPTRRGPFLLNLVGRLAPGATLEQAQAEADVVARRIEQADSRTYSSLTMPVDVLRDRLVRDAKPALLVMFGAVALVLLIATVNVANLQLARSSGRAREMAVRISLGAGRGRLIRQLLTESVLLATFGGIAGVALAYVGLTVLRVTNAGSIPRIDSVQLDLRVLLFTAVVSVLSGIVFGLTPAIQTVRANQIGALRDGDRQSTSGRGRRGVHAALVVVEIALSLMLLVGAGLLLRSFFLLQRVDLGFRASPSELITMRLSPTVAKFTDQGGSVDTIRAMAYFEEMLGRVRRVPGIESAALAQALPPDRFIWSDSFVVDGQSPDEAVKNPSVVIPGVSPDYFRAMGIPLIAGRWFTERDTSDAPLVTVISQNMQRRYFAGRNPIGTRLKLSGPGLPDNPKLEIIGVVGDVSYMGPQYAAAPVYYRSFAQALNLRTYLVVRSALGASAATAVRGEVQAFDKDVVIREVTTMDQAMTNAVAGARFRMLLLGVFAGVALLLATTGVYGVMTYSVSQRRHEMGLRLALGAARRDVLSLILGQAAWLAGLGIAVGTGGAWLLSKSMATLLFHVDATDPLTFASVAACLAVVGLAASALPARRAMRTDPMVALRHE